MEKSIIALYMKADTCPTDRPESRDIVCCTCIMIASGNRVGIGKSVENNGSS